MPVLRIVGGKAGGFEPGVGGFVQVSGGFQGFRQERRNDGWVSAETLRHLEGRQGVLAVAEGAVALAEAEGDARAIQSIGLCEQVLVQANSFEPVAVGCVGIGKSADNGALAGRFGFGFVQAQRLPIGVDGLNPPTAGGVDGPQGGMAVGPGGLVDEDAG